MDPDNGYASRVERSLWSVWYYLTGAVNRLLRPEPTTPEYNDPDSFQQPGADSEPADSLHPDFGGRGVDEDRPLATTSLLSPPRSVVVWDLSSTSDDFGPEEDVMQYRSQLGGGPESKVSEEAEGTREEQLGQTGTGDARLVKAAKEYKEVGDEKSYTHGQEETTEDEGPLNITDDDMSEEVSGYGRKAGAEEDDHGKVDEKGEDDKMHIEQEPTLEMEDAEITLCFSTDLSPEEERYMHIEEARMLRDAAEEGETRDGLSQLGSEIRTQYDEGREQVEHQLLVCEELPEKEVKGDPGSSSLEDELSMTLGKSGKVSEGVGLEHVMGELGEEEEEAADHQAMDEEFFIEQAACYEEVVQNSEAELQTAEFRDKEKQDVAKCIEVQTITPETDDVNEEKLNVATTEVSVEERYVDKDQTEVMESFSSEVKDNKESNMEAACTTALVTVIPKGQTGQEISGELKNIPPGVGEGHAVVVEEPHSPTSQGAQGGVPEYNNEPGPDENTTQRFLEVGNYKESDATQLPEEVESRKWENLQNSGTGGGFSPVREHKKEERDRTEDFKKEDTKTLQITDAGLPQETDEIFVEPAVEGSGQKDETFSSSMKTRTEKLEEEFETHVSATEETPKKTEEQDGAEELLVDFETHEDLSETKEAAGGDRESTGEALKILKAEEQRMTEMSFYQVSGDTEQNTIKTLDFGDIIESGFMKQLEEPKLPEGSSVEMQDAGIDMEETGSGVEEQGTEDEMENKNEMEALNLAAELTSENNKNIWFAKSELTTPDESLEGNDQPSDEASEARGAADQLMTTKSTPKDLDVKGKEEMELEADSDESSFSRSQDLIDEAILDLWIETASFKEADGMEPREGPEPGGQLDKKGEEQSDDTDEENEKLVESMSGESGLVSDTEMSPSAAESGLLDQSVSGWSTDPSESHLLESTSSGSPQDILDLFTGALESADVSELSARQPDSESQDASLEEAAETGQSDLTEEESTPETGFHPGSGTISLEAGCCKERSDKSQDKTDEERVAESDTGKQKESDWKDSGEEDPETLYTEEKTEDADAPREAAASHSPGETEDAESGRPGSGSEVLSQDEITMRDSEDVTFDEKLEQPQDTAMWEDVTEGEEEEPTATQVDASALDFTPQKSRIAVKNPRVRPPSDPRSLLHMPSADPTPSPRLTVKVPRGVPLGGMGIGIKLPGLGAGFPALKKTKRVMTEEKSSETSSQEPETKPEEQSDAIKEEEEKPKPKWMPPRHPGFGNPLMSELKNKLRKPTDE